MRERQGLGFTVDELAERADVSRRTVFNHFASVDDIVFEVCSEEVGALIGDMEAGLAARAAGEFGPMPVFDQVADVLRSADLVSVISYLTRVLGSAEYDFSPHTLELFTRVIGDFAERLSASLMRHHPSSDVFVVHLMFGALTAGLLVVREHWHAITGGVDTEESRRVWAELLEQLIDRTRGGYGSAFPETQP
ncbi:hypothetical protein GCM10027294_44190 [Marinactinospora endophytica]